MRANLNLNDCTGAKVTAGFNSPSVAAAIGQKSPHIKRGTELPLDVLKTIPSATLDAMVTNGRHLMLRPRPAGEVEKEPERLDLERVVVAAEGGKFDVIEGVKINTKPLTQRAAAKLADAGVVKH